VNVGTARVQVNHLFRRPALAQLVAFLYTFCLLPQRAYGTTMSHGHADETVHQLLEGMDNWSFVMFG
jgi:hypothetical protein